MTLRDDEVETFEVVCARFRALGFPDPEGAARRWMLHERARRDAKHAYERTH